MVGFASLYFVTQCDLKIDMMIYGLEVGATSSFSKLVEPVVLSLEMMSWNLRVVYPSRIRRYVACMCDWLAVAVVCGVSRILGLKNVILIICRRLRT